MNEYNYDYLEMNGMIPSNFQTNYINPIYQMNNMPNQPNLINQNYPTDNTITAPNIGFIRGNLFSNLYDPYRNFKPQDLNPSNEKEAMLMSWQQYNFALLELNLYLDNYPTNKEAINLYRQYINILKDIETKYEEKYGPICTNSISVLNGSWRWNNNPWPWEGEK